MNPDFGNNRLLNRYNNGLNRNDISFQNNMLLQNNPIFMNMDRTQQFQQMQMLQSLQTQQAKEMQQVKHINKMNELNNKYDKEKIRESVIKPIRIEKNKKDRFELDNKWKEAEKNYRDNTGKNYGNEIQEYWKKRTNQPYKNIIKNEDVSKKNFKSKDDLIVHRVTKKDKEGVDESYNKLQQNLEKHDDELQTIYSTDKRNEHKKKFEYNHVYKYRIQYDPKDHDKLKQDRIKYYKDRQKKEEEGKRTIDNILETLINDGIFDKNELSIVSLDIKESKNTVSDTSSDSKKSTQSKQNKKEAYLNRKRKNN